MEPTDKQLLQLTEDVYETVLKLDFHYDRLSIGTALTQIGLKIIKQETHPEDFHQLLKLIYETKHLL
jgi:hypothetical protein